MKTKTNTLRKITSIFLVALTLLMYPIVGHAAQITNRSLTLGSSAVSTATTHAFAFTVPTTGNVGSIQFLYCTTASGTCSTPSGLITTSATLTAQSGATGFTINNTTAGAPYLTRTAASITGGTALSYTLSNVTNPSAANTTFYVRISTFASIDTTGGATDTGVVAASTAGQITLTGTMPESLIFCVGTSGTDCTNITGNSVNFGFFSPTSTSTGTSLMSASTNASSGYTITVNGSTLASGIHPITPMGTQTPNSSNNAASTIGTSQFGTNVRANTTPSVGTDVTGGGIGAGSGGYNTANAFRFFSGDTIASAAGPTKANTFTNSYIVNVGGDQSAGAYTATMTYICTASF